MIDDEPTWEILERLISTNGLSESGAATMRWALGRLRTLLGDSWPRRQFRKQGQLPSELLLAGSHRAALPQALAFVLRLDGAVHEPSFVPVLRELKRGVDFTAWRHVLLQLEVARAAAGAGAGCTFEPAIPDSPRKGDLLIGDGTASPWMVETTTIPRADIDKNWHAYEDDFAAAIRAIETRRGVACVVVLNDHMAADDTRAWLAAVDAVAESSGEVSQVVASEIGTVTVHRQGLPPGTTVFTGAAQYRDGWHRLGRALAGKAKQIRGPRPTWIRVDCLDGLFQFTDWARMPPAERVGLIAGAVREQVSWPDNAEGVVLSTGPAVSLGATDACAEEQTVSTADGTLLRRLLAPHLLRETLVLPLHAIDETRAAWWARAYAGEPTWLDEDLRTADHPALVDLWRAAR